MADRFDYADYEFTLRDRQWNRDALAVHVSHFQGCGKVLDLACGSGIFLELLAEQDIPAIGVERNPDVVAWVKQHGWDIIEQMEVQRETLVGWADKTNEAVNQMWAWPDDVYIVCRKTEA